jgi:hypothetical protein
MIDGIGSAGITASGYKFRGARDPKGLRMSICLKNKVFKV